MKTQFTIINVLEMEKQWGFPFLEALKRVPDLICVPLQTLWATHIKFLK